MTTRFFTITHDITGIRVHDSAKDSSCWFGNVADLGYAYAELRVSNDERQARLDEIDKLTRIDNTDSPEIRELKSEVQRIVSR